MMNVPGISCRVPGTRNSQNPCQCWDVPSVPSVPRFSARVRDTCGHASSANIYLSRARIYTRNTRNTRNKPVNKRLSDVPGIRNTKNKPGTQQMTKPLRQAMPTVAAWIDELRDAFGTETVNASIKAEMEGQQTFYASENGQQVGTQLPYCAEKSVKLSDIHIGPMVASKAKEGVSK